MAEVDELFLPIENTVTDDVNVAKIVGEKRTGHEATGLYTRRSLRKATERFDWLMETRLLTHAKK